MTFSVIIPTYNRGYCIGKCIDSVLSQNFENFEVIIVDDGSTDNTQQLIETYSDKRLKYLKLDENTGGPNRPKNIGAKAAKGEWLVFHDSDDLLTPNALEYLSKLLESHTKIELLFAACEDIKGKSTSNIPNYNDFISFKDYFTNKVEGEYLPIIRKDIFLKYYFFENIISGESYTWKLIAKKHVTYISNYVARIYDNEGDNRVSTKNKKFYQRVLRCHLMDVKVHWKNYLSIYPFGLVKVIGKMGYYLLVSYLQRS